ncbi:hypothetical protein SD70_27675, partial [Gordoniibacillus kamchatkensis]
MLRQLGAGWDEASLRASPVTLTERELVRGHRERQAALAEERARLQAEREQAVQREEEARDEQRQAAAELESARQTFALTYPWPLDADTDTSGAGEDPVRQLQAIRRDYDEWRRLEAEAAHVREREGDERRHAEQLRRSWGRLCRPSAAGERRVTL